MLKDFVQLHYDIEDGTSTLRNADSTILQSVSANMQLKHLQSSSDEEDKKMLSLMHEADSMLSESASSLMKMSFIAGLMAISSLLPANALSKALSKAKF